MTSQEVDCLQSCGARSFLHGRLWSAHKKCIHAKKKTKHITCKALNWMNYYFM